MTKINSIKTSNGSVHKIDEGIGFPSGKYVDLELKESDSAYIAPANGYFYVCKVAAKVGQFIQLTSNAVPMTSISAAPAETSWLHTWLPVTKGCKCYVKYSATGETRSFRFIYAQGSESDEE